MAGQPVQLPPFLTSPPRAVLASIREVIEQLYGAVGDDDAINEVCRQLGRGLKASWIALHHYNFSSASGSVLIPILGVDERLSAAYNEHYAATNVWMLRGRHMIRPRSVTVSHLLCPDEVLARSEWCNDFLEPNGVFHSIGCVVQTARDTMTTVTFLRGRRLGNYTTREQQGLQALGPHLENCLRLHEKVRAAQAFGQIGLQLLDRMPTGVVLVDRAEKVVAVNSAAEAVLEARDGLELVQGRLATTVPASGGTVRRAIQAATGRAGDLVLPPGGSARVLRASGLRPYAIWVAPLQAPNSSSFDHSAAAVIFITDPEGTATVDAQTLTALFRLTASEADLTVLLASGVTLRAAAARMGVSINTARTHLARVFLKTDTHRQSDLVRVILSAPGRTGDRWTTH